MTDQDILKQIQDDCYGEVFLNLNPQEKRKREILTACAKNVFEWDEVDQVEYKNIIRETFYTDTNFFKELLSNGENDSSILTLAAQSVSTNEEILFLAMEADKRLGRMPCSFSVFATAEQKANSILVKQLLQKYPEARDFL